MGPRPLGLRMIIGYKTVKVPAMVGLAVWLTFARGGASAEFARLAEHLAEGGWVLHRIGVWLGLYVTPEALKVGAVVAWLDAAATALEVTLLLLGKSWGEWLVVAGLGVLIPLEIYWLTRHATVSRLGILLVNAAVFAYLVRRRVVAARALASVTR